MADHLGRFSRLTLRGKRYFGWNSKMNVRLSMNVSPFLDYGILRTIVMVFGLVD